MTPLAAHDSEKNLQVWIAGEYVPVELANRKMDKMIQELSTIDSP
jgi:hypothetical protein